MRLLTFNLICLLGAARYDESMIGKLNRVLCKLSNVGNGVKFDLKLFEVHYTASDSIIDDCSSR